MKKKLWIFAAVAIIVVAAVVLCLAKDQDTVALRKGKAAYNLYTSSEEDKLDTTNFLFVQDENHIVAIKDGVISETVYQIQREALQWLYDDTETVFDESLGYGTVSSQTEKLFGCTPVTQYAGKKISFLGDSISTYEGVSNNTDYNPTMGEHFVFYNSPEKPEAPVLTQADTWWQQVIDTLGMELCVNNSNSGTRVRTNINGLVNAGFYDRCVQLHNAQEEEPDVIIVFMGTNDFTRDFVNLGRTKNLDYDAVEAAVDAGTDNPETVCEAYAMMLYKITKRYPNAEVYCMTLLPRRTTPVSGKEDYSQFGQPLDFNENLRSIIAHYECKLIDLEKCGVPEDGAGFDYFIEDQGLHPGKNGMDIISNAAISAMLGETPYTLKNVENYTSAK